MRGEFRDKSTAAIARGDGSPKVSIGLPVFNGEDFLEHALESILSQNFQDFELVIADNASTDGTEAICAAFAARDGRVRYFRNRANFGVALNWNQVFRLSSGKYFKWAAHDDVVGPNFLYSCTKVLDEDPGIVLCYPRSASIDDEGNITADFGPSPDVTSLKPSSRFATMMRNPFWTTALFGVIRADVLVETGLHGNFIAGDHVLLSELSLRGRFCETPEVAFYHRDYAGRLAHQRSPRTRVAYIDPSQSRASFLRLMLVRGYERAIARAPVEKSEKVRCHLEVARWIVSRLGAQISHSLRIR